MSTDGVCYYVRVTPSDAIRLGRERVIGPGDPFGELPPAAAVGIVIPHGGALEIGFVEAATSISPPTQPELAMH